MNKANHGAGDIIRQIANGVAFIATVVMNGLANALPLNGQTTGQISDRFPVYFVPAGYVFSIWGVIYLLQLGFTIYQALPSQRDNAALRRIGYLPALAGLLNSVWIVLWHYEYFPLTLIVMAGLLATLIAIYVRLEVGRSARVSSAAFWLTHTPYSVYLGWITVATVANATTLLYILGWDGFGLSAELWAVIMLVVGALIAGTVVVTRRDVAYTLVIVWAYAGIVVKQAGAAVVADTAALMAVAVAVALLATLLLQRFMPRSRQARLS